MTHWKMRFISIARMGMQMKAVIPYHFGTLQFSGMKTSATISIRKHQDKWVISFTTRRHMNWKGVCRGVWQCLVKYEDFYLSLNVVLA